VPFIGHYLPHFKKMKNSYNAQKLTPIIGKNTKIAKNVTFEDNFAHIGDNVTIGENTRIGYGVYIDDDCHIGSNTEIRHNTVLLKGTLVGSWTTIGALCSSQGYASVGNFVNIYNQSQIGWGMNIEDRVFFGPRFAPSNTSNIQHSRDYNAVQVTPSRICFGARIGSGVTILPNVTIGREAYIGAGAVVTKSIPEFTIAFGNPAKSVKEVQQADRIPEQLYQNYIKYKKTNVLNIGLKKSLSSALKRIKVTLTN